MKRLIFGLLVLLLFSAGCGGEEEEPSYITLDDPDRELVINSVIINSIDDGNFSGASLRYIEINEDASTPVEAYIALVHMNFDYKNTIETANSIMQLHSDALTSSVARRMLPDLTQIVVFWKDDYNNRTVKYAYEYKAGSFQVVDVAGE